MLGSLDGDPLTKQFSIQYKKGVGKHPQYLPKLKQGNNSMMQPTDSSTLSGLTNAAHIQNSKIAYKHFRSVSKEYGKQGARTIFVLLSDVNFYLAVYVYSER